MGYGWLFTNLATAVGVCYGWLNPFFGLMVYTAFAILRPPFLWFWSWPGGDAPRYSFYIALSTLVGWTIKGFGDRGSLKYIRLPMVGLVMYLFAGIVAWRLMAVDGVRAWAALNVQIKIGLMAFVTLSLVRTGKQIQTFAWILLLTLGYLAFEFNNQYLFDSWNRIYWRGFGGVDNNGVAMIMVMGVPLAFFLGINAKTMFRKALCFFTVACMVHVILFSFSRGGQLGLCIVGLTLFVIALFKLPRKGWTLLLAIVFVWLGMYLAGDEVRERFWTIFADQAERDKSAASRFDTWSAAWRCIKDHPMGVGPRNFNAVSHQYGLPVNKSVHNLMLQTGADYGVLGMLGLFLFYGVTIVKTFVMASHPTAVEMGWPRYFGHMVCISLTGFMVCSMFIGMESVETGFLIALLGLCTVNHVYLIAEQNEIPDDSPESERLELYRTYGYMPPA